MQNVPPQAGEKLYTMIKVYFYFWLTFDNEFYADLVFAIQVSWKSESFLRQRYKHLLDT